MKKTQFKEFAKAENVLTTQIRIENVKLTNFLYKRRVSDIDLSTCLCNHQKQIMKHVIVSFSQHDRIEIKNERKSMNYRNLINTLHDSRAEKIHTMNDEIENINSIHSSS